MSKYNNALIIKGFVLKYGVLFDLSGAAGTCKPKVLDVLLLDGGGQHAIILAVTNCVIEVIIK